MLIGKEGVKDLYFVAPPDPITLTRENLAKTFINLEEKGMAGVVCVQVDGELLLKKGFGMANDSLGVPNTTETIFGIGSRPIDFTKTAIHLLEQQGKIDQDDTIEKYFDRAPSGKRAVSIRHLMTGRSGLPDFFHTNQDWDPDLAWIDRAAAVDRILNQPLLFKPGTDRRHSHAAFVLLAALIEKVSDTPYYTYLDQSFFNPAGMRHTNEYGKTGGHSVSDFTVGGRPQRTGLPNIPPNWGPASWLIKGSGGCIRPWMIL